MSSIKPLKFTELEVPTNKLDPKEKAQVVIVGAGLAGLAAAQRLYKTGIRDIVILDAQDRIGGRVYTVNHSNYFLELGAQWLHGANENPLFEWLNEKNMLDDYEDASASFDGLYCTNEGKEIDRELVRKFLDIMVECKLSFSKNHYSELIASKGFKNARQVFKHQLSTQVQLDHHLNEQKDLIEALFDWFMRYESIENCCDSMNDVSTASYTDWTDYSDGALLNFRHGYRSLLDWFCEKIPTNLFVSLNKQVLKIELLKKRSETVWLDRNGISHEYPILLTYTSRDLKRGGELGSIECHHVIMTASIGYLKDNHKTLFYPMLPKEKQNVLNSIGFGTVNKIVLQFEEPFWDGNHGIKLVWKHKNNDNFPTWVKDIIAFDTVRGQPNLLIGWIGGLGAKLVEQESDIQVGETCQRLLATFLPQCYSKPTRIVGCIVSRWYSNPFTRGSYSFQSMDSFDQNVEHLHEPIYEDELNPRIMFAGEATAGKLYSTAHGAVITGWREANRLREYLLGIYDEEESIESVTSNDMIV